MKVSHEEREEAEEEEKKEEGEAAMSQERFCPTACDEGGAMSAPLIQRATHFFGVFS